MPSIVLPSCFHPSICSTIVFSLIFKELLNNMEHLKVDRVLALIRESYILFDRLRVYGL